MVTNYQKTVLLLCFLNKNLTDSLLHVLWLLTIIYSSI